MPSTTINIRDGVCRGKDVEDIYLLFDEYSAQCLKEYDIKEVQWDKEG